MVVSPLHKGQSVHVVPWKGAAPTMFQPSFMFCGINQMSSLAGLDGQMCFHIVTSTDLCKLKETASTLDPR